MVGCGVTDSVDSEVVFELFTLLRFKIIFFFFVISAINETMQKRYEPTQIKTGVK